MSSPHDLVERLCELFPAFAAKWNSGEGWVHNGEFSYHSVFITFAPLSCELLRQAEPKRVITFCHLVNQLVAAGGDLENAVSTCFLEHASQIGVRRIIKPHLSKLAMRELR